MNRRSFLTLLSSGALGAAAHTLDLDRLLWVPGQKTIFLPPPSPWVYDETGIALRFVREWAMLRPRPPLMFHENAFAYVMEPLSRPIMCADLSDAYGVVFGKSMSRAEVEARYPGILKVAP